MKPKALYHLLLDRARHMRVHDVAEIASFLDAVEDSIEVTFEHSIYTIRWEYQERKLSINANHEDFEFYLRGDLGLPTNRRNIRLSNWEAALDLWRKIARQSGQDWPDKIANHQSAVGLKLNDDVASTHGSFVSHCILAVLLLIIGVVLGGPLFGLSASITVAALTYLSRGRDGLRKGPWPQRLNDLMIAVPAIVIPYLYGISHYLTLAFALSLIAIAHALEQYKPFNRYSWVGFFAVFAVFALYVEDVGLSWALFLFSALWLVCAIVVPGRYSRSIVIAGLVALLLTNLFQLSFSFNKTDLPDYIWPMIIIAGALTAIGWFIGEMSSLSSWLIHSLIGFAGIGVLISSDAKTALALSAVLGFLIIEALRMLTAFRSTRATPIVLPDGSKVR